jgi:hypothetical protein
MKTKTEETTKEYLQKIQEMIEEIAKSENSEREIKVIKDFVEFRMKHSTPELNSLRDVYYFLLGLMFNKGISDYWNGRDKK